MARFDVFRNPDGAGYVVDCQSNIFDEYRTRVVVPLLPPDIAPKPVRRLNPQFVIEGAVMTMTPHFIASVPVEALGATIMSLSEEEHAITGSIDMLMGGF